MPIVLDWKQVALRLALTVLAGAIIGINRGEHGRPAGMRTTLLVCLAASLSMILANLLIGTAGKKSDSFVQLDMMRLPLGVLSGMGFIGAGTILRKGNLVMGITTAATLWFVTIMGMCFGAGANGLGLAALAIGCIVLWALKPVEKMIKQDVRGTMSLTINGEEPTDAAVRLQIAQAGCAVVNWGITFTRDLNRREIHSELQWRPREGNTKPPPFIEVLRAMDSVVAVAWQPQGEAS